MGVRVTKNRIDDMQRDLSTGFGLESLLDKAAADVQGRMMDNIVKVDFVDTGATLTSVRVERKRRHRLIGPTTHYAVYGEFGTRHMRARPFAAPALKSNRRAITRAFEKYFERFEN